MFGRAACLLLGVGAGLTVIQITASAIVAHMWRRSVARTR